MKAFTVSLLAAVASAHTTFQTVWVNGVSQGYLKGVRGVSYNGPILDVTSNDIICNTAANTYFQNPAPSNINVNAGDTVTTEWHYSSPPTATDMVIDASHKGPIIVYLAKVDSLSSTTVTGLKWFKIYEDGLSADAKTWAVDKLIANKGKVSFTIPKCIPAGNYLMRAELIALHPAATYPGAQFYMECAQLVVSSSGTTVPPTVSFPGAYKGSDPGITFQLYYPVPKNYTVPGPKVFTC